MKNFYGIRIHAQVSVFYLVLAMLINLAGGFGTDIYASIHAENRHASIRAVYNIEDGGANGNKQVLFIDSLVPDYQALIDGVIPGVEVILLDRQSPEIMQIAEILANRTNINAVHILSHGDVGRVMFFGQELNIGNIATYESQMRVIGNAISPDGDIFLYGCRISEGAVGLAFINALSDFTEADITASGDLTGAHFLNGNWKLEAKTGEIESRIAFSPKAILEYRHLLAPPSIQAHSIVFSNIQSDRMTISWTRGNGNFTTVFIKATTTGSATPLDGVNYSANTVFSNGTQIGSSGWYCIYDSTGTSVTVTGLTQTTTYRVFASERTADYNTNAASNNPRNQMAGVAPTVTTQMATAVAGTTATGNGNITDLGAPNPTAHGVCWSTTANPTIADSKTDNGGASSTGAFTGSMTGLAPGTLYHYRAYATNAAGTSYGADTTFTTLEPPMVTTQAATSVGTTAATGNGNIADLGNPNPTQHGVCWSTTVNPTTADSKTTQGVASSTGSFTSPMTGLSPGTTYHYRAYATNTSGTSYGADVTFTTDPIASTVTTQAATAVASTTATGNGNITDLGAPTPTAHGVCWSTTSNPTIADSKTDNGGAGSTGAFTGSMSGLAPGTLYHYRAYATNTAGTVYGADQTFTTLIADLSVVKSNDAGGAVLLGENWTWTASIRNTGTGMAVFTNGQVILTDQLPDSDLNYGATSLSNVTNITNQGNISAIIAGNVLTVSASGGSVTIGASNGRFDIDFTATPSAIGSFDNPRSGGTCTVDPNTLITESNESNNTPTTDTVTVTAPDLSVVKTNDKGGSITLGGDWTWSVSLRNTGNEDATFTDTQVILTDNLPDTNINYALLSMYKTNITNIIGDANIQATIAGNNLTVSASGGNLTIGAGTGRFDIEFTASPTAEGTFVNPRGGGVCAVDPNTFITESDETNNTAIDTVTVAPPPTVTNVSSTTGDGTYYIGATIDITVQFNEAVTVTGTPTLTLETGSSDAVVDYSSGSGSDTLTFTYTVLQGHTSANLDFRNTTALSDGGGTIRDGVGNDAVLTLVTPGNPQSLGANKALVIDGIPRLVINEIDYNQGATDDAEFIEIKNISGSSINLNGYALQLVDNSGGPGVYQTINLGNVDLTGGDYYVICNTADTTVNNCDQSVSLGNDFIQDGPPDAMRLVKGIAVLDTVSYGGDTALYTETAGAPADSDTTDTYGLSRIPDGSDTNDNSSDFVLRCITPGVTNGATAPPGACNLPAEVDLNGGGAGNDNTTSFTENGGAILIASAGTVTDANGGDIQSLTFTITNDLDGALESLALNAFAQNAVINDPDVSVTAYDSGTGILEFSGAGTTATYQTILQGIEYNNTDTDPDTTSRAITVIANDGIDDSTTRTSTISITSVEEPTVTTQEATSVFITTAIGNGNITDLGSPNPSQHGVCWSKSANPTISDSRTEEGPVTSTGSFESTITGLAPFTTYHYRAYATNSAGTSYGADRTFTSEGEKFPWLILMPGLVFPNKDIDPNQSFIDE